MIYVFWIVLALVVGFLGKERTTGFWGAFILSLILSPLIGVIIVALSKRT
jgi:tetrahydromethanopterin S-methyltransferase subunit C